MGRIIEEIYVWRLPVRLYHWINAICITVLFATGIYIASPVLVHPPGEAVWQKGMAWWRYVHFASAFIFIANFLFRMYWAVFGRDTYARFGGFRPWSPSWWGKPFREQLESYLFLRSDEPNYAGHNPVAALAHFLFIFCGSVFMILSGLAMFGENNPGGAMSTWFGWMLPLFGGSYGLHYAHHIVTWIFPFYLVVHLYAVLRHDVVDRTSVTSSIITGYKHKVEEEPT
ncbi:Ni/Fe-hydrogenase, b-type cytochrome subunit [Pelodictyon luteolum]|uniref:Nickel-dependent hydrogenase b-type cytochrome subunit n=1 Tax=Chlorobium luteolum (strain DSM 273 / BCRC 81028 / 2530) TaxID=319225 RepID=Q3B2X4_CHLL3|nr:Ni/Fe-hydrogenase, b-type cytochrome subunit [Pelodictyon luteolum]ABB24307.1 Nickel-dependent hydrogenase b-type cytochrome subunit [Pelodictyon luteolum DSM 273]